MEDPFYTHDTGIDKSAIVRYALQQDPAAVFAGDGRPDLQPAGLVGAAGLFARGWLARHLEQKGRPFQPFKVWSDIAHTLLKEPPPC